MHLQRRSFSKNWLLQQRREAAIREHIGNAETILQRLRCLDGCQNEDEVVDLLAKASVLAKLDAQFCAQLIELQKSANLSVTTKALLQSLDTQLKE